MEEEELNKNINKRSKPSVPQDFFEKFQNKLENSIDDYNPAELLDESSLNFLVKTKKPNLPDGYFTKSTQNILNKIEKGKVVSFKPRRLMYAVSAIAAILLIGLLVVPFLNKENPTDVLAETEVVQESSEFEYDDELSLDEMDNYLAFIDESTLVDYYLESEEESTVEGESINDAEEEIELTEEEEVILDYIGEDFEDIYFDL